MDYKSYFNEERHGIRRMVWGYEQGETNMTKHLQGYVELVRSQRTPFVKRILPQAWWKPAFGSSLENYRYCKKSGVYDTIGDFSKEEAGMTERSPVIASVPQILRGLMVPKLVPQIKVSKEYSEKWQYYDRTANYLKTLQTAITLFEQYQAKKLYPWQYAVLRMIMEQDDRKVLWITDSQGNNGKTFLARYLEIMYQFYLIDGTVSLRDLAYTVPNEINGLCVDVGRPLEPNFDYATLEGMKNGYVMTGKYGGRIIRRTEHLKVVVFANFYPEVGKLSSDRWTIQTVGSGDLLDIAKTPIITPQVVYPFVPPPTMPDLRDSFSLKSFLEQELTSPEPADNQPANSGDQTEAFQLSAASIPSTFGQIPSYSVTNQELYEPRFPGVEVPTIRQVTLNISSQKTLLEMNMREEGEDNVLMNLERSQAASNGTIERIAQPVVSPRNDHFLKNVEEAAEQGKSQDAQSVESSIIMPGQRTPCRSLTYDAPGKSTDCKELSLQSPIIIHATPRNQIPRNFDLQTSKRSRKKSQKLEAVQATTSNAKSTPQSTIEDMFASARKRPKIGGYYLMQSRGVEQSVDNINSEQAADDSLQSSISN